MEKTEEHKKYISSLKKPSLDRVNEKYYDEMQHLAYNLVRFLRMNDDKKEHGCQGNYNFTYLKENMSEKDFVFVMLQFMRRVPIGELRSIIRDNFTDSSVELLYFDHFDPRVGNRNFLNISKFKLISVGLSLFGLGGLVGYFFSI